jgi:hypothetical protein
MAQGIFDGLLGASLDICTYTEKYKHPTAIDNNLSAYGRYFLLKHKNPITITTINGASPGTYYLEDRGLWLETALNEPTTFPYLHTIVYTAGYSIIPDDVLACILSITAILKNTVPNSGMTSFRQDKLQVDYSGNNGKGYLETLDPSAKSLIMSTVNKYKVFNLITT